MEIEIVDKPWRNEPKEMEFEYKGIKCYMMRGPLGCMNGYVQVPEGHPWHEKGYDDIDASVHGGLTFSGSAYRGESAHWIGFDTAHLYDLIPYQYDMEWWLIESGTEPELAKQYAAKSKEVRSKYPKLSYPGQRIDTYKGVNYVTQEIHSLVDQLLEAAKQGKQ